MIVAGRQTRRFYSAFWLGKVLFELSPEDRQLAWQGRLKAEGFAGDGVDEAEFGGVESEAGSGDLRRYTSPLTLALFPPRRIFDPGEMEFRAIDFFAADRVALFGEVDADLMGAAGFEFVLDEGVGSGRWGMSV